MGEMGEHVAATNGAGDPFSDREGLVVEEHWVDRVVRVAASGTVDMLTAPRLTEAIGVAVAKSPSAVIIDLSRVEFLASAGLSVLVAAHAEVSPTARFGVVADGPATSRPITLLCLDTVFTLYGTLADALHDLGGA